MPELPGEIFGRWGHSFEEDTGDVAVYRPAEFEFPRARGRPAIEFQPDGTFIDWAVGRGDARQATPGRWQLEAPGRVRISYDDAARPAQTLEVVESDAGLLKVRRQPDAG